MRRRSLGNTLSTETDIGGEQLLVHSCVRVRVRARPAQVNLAEAAAAEPLRARWFGLGVVVVDGWEGRRDGQDSEHSALPTGKHQSLIH